MALIARYFVDTSAAARARHPGVDSRLQSVVGAGLAATCAPLDAEALFSARSPAEHEQTRARRRTAYEHIPTDDEHWGAAFEAQRALARTGRHRAVGIADLLICVLASQHRLTVLHYDTGFEMAAEVIEFEHRWVAPRGTI